MNEPVRIVADWLNDTTSGAVGVNDVLAVSDFPLDTSPADALPANPTYYDSTRHAFAARGLWPAEGQGVTYPCVVTRFGGIDYPLEAQQSTTGAVEQPGVCTVVVIIAQRLANSNEGVEDVGYLVRAVCNSLAVLNLAANRTKRTRNGFTLQDCTSVRVQPMPIEHEDNVIAVGIALTYDTHEATYNQSL